MNLAQRFTQQPPANQLLELTGRAPPNRSGTRKSAAHSSTAPLAAAKQLVQDSLDFLDRCSDIVRRVTEVSAMRGIVSQLCDGLQTFGLKLGQHTDLRCFQFHNNGG
jgi:hypothetical protein